MTRAEEFEELGRFCSRSAAGSWPRLTVPGSQGRPTTGATPTWISQWWA